MVIKKILTALFFMIPCGSTTMSVQVNAHTSKRQHEQPDLTITATDTATDHTVASAKDEENSEDKKRNDRYNEKTTKTKKDHEDKNHDSNREKDNSRKKNVKNCVNNKINKKDNNTMIQSKTNAVQKSDLVSQTTTKKIEKIPRQHH